MTGGPAAGHLSMMFGMLDAGGDALLDGAHFRMRTDQLCAALAPVPGSPGHEELRAAHEH